MCALIGHPASSGCYIGDLWESWKQLLGKTIYTFLILFCEVERGEGGEGAAGEVRVELRS